MVFVFNVVHICFQAEPSKLTLTDFLIKNEGLPCIVVLDVSSSFGFSLPLLNKLGCQDIDKTDEQHLWSLLAPWELGMSLLLSLKEVFDAINNHCLGRCPVESGKRHIDVRKVIWMATSNLGQEIVFEYDDSRDEPGNDMARDEYLELMAVLRPCVTEKLGVSHSSFIVSSRS